MEEESIVKKILSVCIALMLCACAIAYALDSDSKNMDKTAQNGINSEQNVKEVGSAPKYTDKRFEKVDDLVEWIQTEDIDTFQEGRYQKGISSLRENGEILVPSYEGSDMTLQFIEVLPDESYPDGCTAIVFHYYNSNSEKVMVITKELNKVYTNQAQQGVSSYFTAQYGNTNTNKSVHETTIKQKSNPTGTAEKKNAQTSSQRVEQDVSYLMIESSDGSSSSVNQATFLANDFEVHVTQHNNNWKEEYLTDLCLESVSIN